MTSRLLSATGVILSIAAFAFIVLAGAASAQTAGTFVTVTNQTASSTPTPGANGATVATFQLTASQAGEFGNVRVSSLPLTISAANGAAVGNLSSCQVFDASGTALTTGSNVISSGQSTNTLTFDTPLSLNGGSTQTLTVRCNVASSSPSGGTFALNVGTPVLAPSLYFTMTATPGVQRGPDILLATFSIGANRSASNINVSSIPVSISTGGGASASMLTDCRVRPTSNLSQAYNNGTNVPSIVSGVNTITLDTPLSIPAGSTFTLGLTCDIPANFPANGTIQISVDPAGIKATVAGSNAAVTPVRGFVGNTTTVGATSGTVVVAPTGTVVTPPTVPGVPNTGLGDSPLTLALLLASGIAMLSGIWFLARRRYV